MSHRTALTAAAPSLAIAFLALLSSGPAAAAPPRSLDVAAGIIAVNLLPQNWTDAQSNWFYNVPQGSKLLRYDWFLHLEQPNDARTFRDAAHVRKLGYLARTPDPANPDGLPIGFVKDGDHLGITCAACHTAQINYKQQAWLVDGAPTLGDFETFLRELVAAMTATLDDPAKFNRLAARVLGADATAAATAALRTEFADALAARRGYNARNLPRGAGAVPFGPGRVDAFGAILNEVATTVARVVGNDAPADAPVSYPALWDTPQHGVVQWTGAAKNRTTKNPLLIRLAGTEHIGALGRNAGEVLGVFGTMDAARDGSLLTFAKAYTSSIRRDNLIEIEKSLGRLWSPEWPGGLPPIDRGQADAGKALFRTHCADCHNADFDRTKEDRVVGERMEAVGTDPRTALNFLTRRSRTGILEGRLTQLLGGVPRRFEPTDSTALMLSHVVQRGILRPDLDFVRLVWLDRRRLNQSLLELGEQVDLGVLVEQAASKLLVPSDFHASRNPPAPSAVAYKARPLNGIWATAPYLHNGSVPNLDELLKPSAKRSQSVFKVGNPEFDPVKVGFVSEGEFGVDFDPKLPGNSNAGHDYGREFTEAERRQLVEYLKSL